MARPKLTFGAVAQNCTGAYYARYWRHGKLHTPGRTFLNEREAWGWLREERRLLDRDEWTPPADRRMSPEVPSLTFGKYAEAWLTKRETRGRELRPRTRELYQTLFDNWLKGLWTVPLAELTRERCATWYRGLRRDSPTMRAHAYALARSILKSAVDDELIAKNPLSVRGAGRSSRSKTDVELFSVEEVARLAELMPPKHRLIVLLAAWCGLRFGELAALRRSDITLGKDGASGTPRVSRGVVTVRAAPSEQQQSRLKYQRIVGDPKTEAGARTVVIPPHILPDVREHLAKWAQDGKDGLLFPPSPRSTQAFITPMQVYGHASHKTESGRVKPGYGYYGAREQLGRPDLVGDGPSVTVRPQSASVVGLVMHHLDPAVGDVPPQLPTRGVLPLRSRGTELG